MSSYTKDGLPDMPVITAPVIGSILELAPSKFRAPILGNPDGSRRQWIFDDAQGKYLELPYVPVEQIRVSSVESFRELVVSRLLLKPDVEDAVVLFTNGGAVFTNGKASLDSYHYNRCLHPVWRAVTVALGKTFDHAGFLRFLHGISTAVTNYQDVVRQFKRVVFNQNASISSAPMLDDEGGAHLSYKLEMTARDGKSQARLPGELALEMPYTVGGVAQVVPIELDIALSQQQSQQQGEGGRSSLRFTLFAPTIAEVEMQALRDEVLDFKGAMPTGPNATLLILEDF